MNRLVGLCVLVGTVVQVVVNRAEIAAAWRGFTEWAESGDCSMLGDEEEETSLPAQALRQVMDITRPPQERQRA